VVAILAVLAIRLTLSTTVATEPARVMAMAQIPRSSEHRGACLAVWETGADTPLQESCWGLEGTREVQFRRSFSGLLAGEYILTLTVRTTTGDLQQRRQFVVG
jgi:hypothetical protein